MAVVDIKREKSKWRKFIAEGGGGGGGSSFVTEVVPGGTPVADPDLGDVSLLVTAANAQTGNSNGQGNPIAADIGGVSFTAQVASGGVAEVIGSDGPFGEQYVRVDDGTGLTNAHYEYDPGAGVFLPADFQGDDWTIEFHWRTPENSGALRDTIGAWEFTERMWEIGFSSQTPGSFRSYFVWSTTGSDSNGGTQQIWPGAGGALNTWYHIAVVREGTDIRFYVDGVNHGPGQTPGTDVFNSGSARFVLGGSFNGGAYESHLANVRITKGVARYSANFTPPAVPYQGSDTILQIGDADKRLQLIGEAVQVDANLYIRELARLGVIEDYGQFQAQTSDGGLAWANSNDVKYRVAGAADTATSAELNDIADPINTAGKFAGRRVFNTTTNTPVYATGTATNDVWVDGTGATAHTPV